MRVNLSLSTYVIAGLIIGLNGCSIHNGRYQQRHDSTPQRLPTAAELHDAVPKPEPQSRGGNKHYTVRGKSYQVLANADGFKQRGIASWYGNKFHGHLTSNGEIYNMYSMSAAHKSLPLPTYLKVKNLANNKSVIVRVNDRGPFHDNRIIDLSYSAAYKLDMLTTGTAEVEITAITDFRHQQNTLQIANNNESTTTYIQIFATESQTLAQKTANGLSALYQQPVSWQQADGVYRIKMGPFAQETDITQLLITLKQNGYPQAFRTQ